MLIFFGEHEIAQQVKSGEFPCPICNKQRVYSQHLAQSYFTIFWINVAKLENSSDYLQCNSCESCFNPLITQEPEKYRLAIDKSTILRCLCYLLSGYGDTVHSRKRLIDLYKTHTNLVITNKNIDTELMFINSGNSPTLPFLQNVSNLLSAKAKQVIVLACYQFALGSSMMEHQDRVRINTIGSSINLSLPEVEYLIVNNPG